MVCPSLSPRVAVGSTFNTQDTVDWVPRDVPPPSRLARRRARPRRASALEGSNPNSTTRPYAGRRIGRRRSAPPSRGPLRPNAAAKPDALAAQGTTHSCWATSTTTFQKELRVGLQDVNVDTWPGDEWMYPLSRMGLLMRVP
jgi:hypothetical protein